MTKSYDGPRLPAKQLAILGKSYYFSLQPKRPRRCDISVLGLRKSLCVGLNRRPQINPRVGSLAEGTASKPPVSVFWCIGKYTRDRSAQRRARRPLKLVSAHSHRTYSRTGNMANSFHAEPCGGVTSPESTPAVPRQANVECDSGGAVRRTISYDFGFPLSPRDGRQLWRCGRRCALLGRPDRRCFLTVPEYHGCTLGARLGPLWPETHHPRGLGLHHALLPRLGRIDQSCHGHYRPCDPGRK